MTDSGLTATVGIPTYQRSDQLARVMDSLATQDRAPEEIVIVDDGGTDHTTDLLAEVGPRFPDTALRHIQRSARGLQSARNEIIEHASGDVVCFLDDDVICKPGWLDAIVESYRERPAAVAVGGPAITVSEELQSQESVISARSNQNVITRYGEVTDRSNRWVPPDPVRTDILLGANMSFRRSTLERIGGFDGGYRGTGAFEEYDVFAELWLGDQPVLYHPDAYVSHRKAVTGGVQAARDPRRTNYWWGRNLIRFKWKHFRDSFGMGIARLLLYNGYTPPVWKSIGSALINREPAYLWYIKGYVDGIRYETRWGRRA